MTSLLTSQGDAGKLDELIERVEKATGPDREIDAALASLAGEAPEGWRLVTQDEPGVFKMDAGRWISPSGSHIRTPKPYTASIDAALALVERVLPGWFWRAGHVPAIHWHKGIGYDNWCHLSRTDASNCNPEDESTGWANSVPLAIILATLRAIKTLSGDSHG